MPIVGDRNDIEKNVEKYRVSEIVIAIPSADLQTTREIIRLCQDTKKTGKDTACCGKEPDDIPFTGDQAGKLRRSSGQGTCKSKTKKGIREFIRERRYWSPEAAVPLDRNCAVR